MELTEEQREIALYLKDGRRIEDIAQNLFFSMSYTYEKIRGLKVKLKAKNMRHLRGILSNLDNL